MQKTLNLVIFLLIVLFPASVFACTSFAVFSGNILYGMNFDFADTAMKFLITSNGDFKTFHLAFERVFGDSSFFVKTCGMNTKGLFSSCQEMYTDEEIPSEFNEGSLYIFQLYESIENCIEVSQIKKMAQNSILINLPEISLHNIFADLEGNALVTEPGRDGNELTDTEGSFMVMTNFPNHTLKGKNYKEAKGKGEERYILCHDYLEENLSNFTIEEGLGLLKKVCNKDPDYPTACSMVFDPVKKEVYIVLFRDFNQIYKLSVEECTIELWKENSRKLIIPAGDEGVLVTELLEYFK